MQIGRCQHHALGMTSDSPDISKGSLFVCNIFAIFALQLHLQTIKY